MAAPRLVTGRNPFLRILHASLATCAWMASCLVLFPTHGQADSWQARADGPGPRASHSAVWTGHELIVWGGGVDGRFLNDGGRYNPEADVWRRTSPSNAPSARWFHAAVWTGTEMLIWGGRGSFEGVNHRTDGARYNPFGDRWARISTNGAPLPRSQMAAVWTGTEMIVWGGFGEGGGTLADGARYNPTTDTWTALAPAPLEGRADPTAVWTGTEMIVFGGVQFQPSQRSFGDGARYDPVTDSWNLLPTYGAPGSRWGHTAVWLDGVMLIWGGRELPGETFLDNGARYNYADDSWGPITQEGAPEARMLHAAVWTGTEMIVWGGHIASSAQVNTGARYNLGSLAWTPTTHVGAPGPRMFWRPDLGIWTGNEMIVYGGSDYPTSLNSTFVYRPSNTNAPPPPTNCIPTPAGVVAWWRAEENADDVVASHHGTANSGVSYEPGLVGKAFRVDGAHGRINVPDDESFKLVEALSIEGWVKLANPADGLVLMRGDDRPGLDPYFLGVNPGVISFGISDHQDSTIVSVPFPTGHWKHVAGTFDAGSGFLKLYLDGVVVAQTHTTRRPARDLDAHFNPGLGIGNVSGSSINFPWDGWIDEVALYNRALSDAEILALFNAGQRGKCLTTMPPTPPNNLVFNGSFEVGIDPGELRQIDAPNSTAITGWSVESGNIDYYGSAWVAGDGSRSLDMSGTTAGSISQQVSGFIVGQTYQLSFLMAGNPGLIPPLPGVKQLQVNIGSNSPAQEYSFDATGRSAADLGWMLRTLDFTASSSTMTLSFASLTDGLGGAALDKVSITLLTNAPPPSSTNCVPPPIGLVAWWPFEGTGEDLRGNNPAAFFGNPNFTAGRVGTALHFDGVDDFARTTGSADVETGNGLTIEGWIKPSDLSQLRPIVEWNDGAGSIGAHFWVSVDTQALGDGRGNLFANLVDTAGISHQVWSPANVVHADVWQHVALTYDRASGQATLFRNGTTVARTNLGSFTPQTSFPLYFGLRPSGPSGIHFAGDQDEVSLYNRALQPVEILALYQADGVGKCATSPPPWATYDISRDFSLASNPNGPWSYGYLTALDGSFGLLGAARIFGADNGVPIGVWELNTYQLPIVAKVLGPGTAHSDGDHFTAEPGTIYFAPGADRSPQNFGAIRFTVPAGAGGHYRIEASVRSLFDFARSRDADFHVLKNRQELFGPFLPPNSGASYSNVLVLAGGDTIDFAIGRGADGLTADTGLKIHATLTALGPVTNPPPLAGVYDLGHDYSTNMNPNGVWSFGWKSALNGTLNLFGYHALVLDQGALIDYWLKDASGPSSVYHNAGHVTLTNNSGQGVYPPGTVWFGPGYDQNPDNFSVIRFTVPADGAGTYRVETAVRPALDGLISGDTDFHVLRNGLPLFEEFLPPNTGTTYSNVVALASGDTIDFACGRGEDGHAYASALKIQVRLSLVTNVPPPPPPTRSHDVSRDFSRTRNPNGVWSYGYETTLGGAFTLLTFPLTSYADNPVPVDSWSKNGYEPVAVYHNGTTNTSISDGGTGVFPPGTTWFYPGVEGHQDNYGVIRFTVPAGGGGTYRLQTEVRAYLDGPRSGDTDFHVLKDGVELFAQFVPGNSGTGYSNYLNLVEGGTIDFAVGRGLDNVAFDSGLKIRASLELVSTPPPPDPHCVPPPAGAVAWWRAEGNPNDMVVTNRGALFGGTSYATGKVGRAFAFPGGSSGVKIPAGPGLDVGSGPGLTIEGWINPTDLSIRGPLVEWNRGGSNIVEWGAHLYILRPDEFGLGAGNLVANLAESDGTPHLLMAPGGTLHANTWQHIALTYDKTSGEARLYRSGDVVASATLGSFTPETSYDLYLGRRPAGDAVLSYHGLVDELALYHRALSASEVQAIAHAGTAGKCRISPALDELVQLVEGIPAPTDPEPLLALLAGVRVSIEGGNLSAAIHRLQEFQDEVRARLGAVNPTLSASIIALAQFLIETLDPTGARRLAVATLAGTPMRVERLCRLDGSAWLVTGSAMPGDICCVQRSIDLQTWEQAGFATEVDDGVFEFIDALSDDPMRFYRLQKQ